MTKTPSFKKKKSFSHLVVSLCLPLVFQRPLQLFLLSLQGPVQVLLSPDCLTLGSLSSLQLQLSLEQRGLQSQDLTLTSNSLCTRRLQVKPVREERKTQRAGEEPNRNETKLNSETCFYCMLKNYFR